MSKIRENQHQWKKWLDPRVVEVLEEAGERLEVSWKFDSEYPKSYPVNTDHALSETKAQLNNRAPVTHNPKGLRGARVPAKSLYDLVDDETVRILYEQQYADSYSRAVTQASEGFGPGRAAWRKIMKCLTPAYLIKFGGDDGPKPKVHFLHRQLLGIAKSVEPGLSKEGLADFLDDICPCGKKHKPEAVRKSEERLTKSRGM
jgi:hypothetical protein